MKDKIVKVKDLFQLGYNNGDTVTVKLRIKSDLNYKEHNDEQEYYLETEGGQAVFMRGDENVTASSIRLRDGKEYLFNGQRAIVMEYMGEFVAITPDRKLIYPETYDDIVPFIENSKDEDEIKI